MNYKATTMRDTRHRFSDTTKTLVMTSSITNDLLGKTIMMLIRIKPNILYITVMVTSGCQKHGSRFPVSIRSNIFDRFIALCPKLDERNHNKSEKVYSGNTRLRVKQITFYMSLANQFLMEYRFGCLVLCH